MASMVFSFVLNEVNLKYPSPLGPKPLPGVPTIFNSFSNLSKNSHEVNPSSIFSHMYGEFSPPYTLYPTLSNPSFIILALRFWSLYSFTFFAIVENK